MRNLMFALALCVPACAQTAQMPNAVKVCDEGCTITAMPTGTVYQFGTGTTWVPSASAAKLPLFTYYTSFSFDPAPGVLKEFDVQQKATAYTVTYSTNGVKTVKTIPALAPPPAPTSVLYKVSCTFQVPTTSPMPSTLTLTCDPAVKQ